MSEAAELAESIEKAYGPIEFGVVYNFESALAYVRTELSGETETVINNVAMELDNLRRALNVAKLCDDA